MPFTDMHRPLGSASFRGAVKWIVIVSAVMLLLQQFVPQLVAIFGLVPGLVLKRYWLWQPFTYPFLHGGIFHWLFNMLVIWMFGRELEVRWGTAYFVRFFFICALGAALCVLLLSPQSMTPTIGASGAVFGLLAAFALVFPEAVMYLYFVIPVKAWQAVILFGLIELFAALHGGGVGLGRFAHLGGLVTGYLYLKSREWVLPGAWRPLRFVREKIRFRHRSPVEFHEVTDDLVKEVDRILEKILKTGVESLTAKEKEIMQRYSKLKH
jgi:membrane associated rhomboid family serine protease